MSFGRSKIVTLSKRLPKIKEEKTSAEKKAEAMAHSKWMTQEIKRKNDNIARLEEKANMYPSHRNTDAASRAKKEKSGLGGGKRTRRRSRSRRRSRQNKSKQRRKTYRKRK